MENLVANAVIALLILLTISVSVASGEWSLIIFKAKTNQNVSQECNSDLYQDRFNNLAIISIENDVANSIQYDDIIEEFATSKARKKTFQ